MPHYDTIKFKCPNCGESIVVDDNTADEGMVERVECAVPVKMIARFINREVNCDHCFGSFVINSRPVEFVGMYLSPKP